MTETPGSGFPDPAQPPGGSPRPAGWPPRPDPDRYPPPPPPPGNAGPFAPPATPGALPPPPPGNGGPFAPPGTPGALPPPPPGDVGSLWGQPAPYGQPYPAYAPPPKKKRIWLRVLLTVVGIVVALGVAGAIYAAVRPRHHLSLKDTAAGLPRTEATGGTSQFLTIVTNGLATYNIKHLVSGAYEDGAQQIAIVGGDTGRFDSAQNVIDEFTKGAEQTGQTTLVDYPISGGAHLKCGVIQQRVTLCAWVDSDTFAMVIESTPDASHLAALAGGLRTDLEK